MSEWKVGIVKSYLDLLNKGRYQGIEILLQIYI